MYLEIGMFAMFVFFSVLDVKYRNIKMFWFVGIAVSVIVYKLLFDISSFTSDILVFAVSAILIGVAYMTGLFGPADLLGILLLSFAVPYLGPFPTGICVLVGTMVIQNFVIITSNLAYNLPDLARGISLFDDVYYKKHSRARTVYWFCMARRRRDRDRFVLSAQKDVVAADGTHVLSVKKNNQLLPNTKYVFSAHPQFVFSTVSFFLVWFVGLGL